MFAWELVAAALDKGKTAEQVWSAGRSCPWLLSGSGRLILQPGTWATQPSLPCSGLLLLFTSSCCVTKFWQRCVTEFWQCYISSATFHRSCSQYLEIIFRCPHGKGDKPVVWGQQEFPHSKSKCFLPGSQNNFFWINFCLFVLNCLTTLKEPSRK